MSSERAPRVERTGDTVCITMTRPAKRNAPAREHLGQLLAAFQQAGESDATGIVLAAEGPVFSAGHDFADVAGAPLPWVGTFGQVNVRLYSVDQQGRRGVVFLSLDADRLPPVLAARALGLPYRWASVRVRHDGDRYVYRADRHRGRGHLRLELRPGPPREPDAVEQFVTARWGMHAAIAGRTVPVRVAHEPWRLHRAEPIVSDTDLPEVAGLPPIDEGPVSVLWSPGVQGARIGLSLSPGWGPSRRGWRADPGPGR